MLSKHPLVFVIDHIDLFTWNQIKLELEPKIGKIEDNDGYIKQDGFEVEYCWMGNRELARIAFHDKPWYVTNDRIKQEIRALCDSHKLRLLIGDNNAGSCNA